VSFLLVDAMYKESFFQETCLAIKNKKIKDVMRKNILTVTPTTHIMVIMADFLKNDCYIVPVVEEGKLIGIVTRTEIKRALIEAMESPIPTN
jgi:CBS domain-containing protein